jgi:hypothetical protein
VALGRAEVGGYGQRADGEEDRGKRQRSVFRQGGDEAAECEDREGADPGEQALVLRPGVLAFQAQEQPHEEGESRSCQRAVDGHCRRLLR